MRAALQEPAIADAIDALGYRPLVDHVLAHIGIYGRVIGDEAGSAGTAEEKASAAWHRAFMLFVAQVMLIEKIHSWRSWRLGGSPKVESTVMVSVP